MQPSPCRLFVYLARDAPLGVVLRRGPSAWVRSSLWHTDTDTFEHGQWMKNRVYERRSDISADGSLFVYFARGSRGADLSNKTADSWVAISRPPWFTALALWFVGGTYWLGGYFSDPSPGAPSVFAGGVTRPPNLGQLPSWLAVTNQIPHVDRTTNSTERTVYINRLLRDGWQPRVPGPGESWETWERPQPNGQLILVMRQLHSGFAFHTYGGPYIVEYAVRMKSSGETVPLGQATWADWDQRGRLVLAQDGRLFQWQPSREPGTLHEIADLNDQVPEPAPSPLWARSWPR
jgi:hypothetical protein